MSGAEVVILVVALVVAVGILMGIGRSSFFSGGAVGHRSLSGRLHCHGERETMVRDRDPASIDRGGHQPEPPGMRKQPYEGGLL